MQNDEWGVGMSPAEAARESRVREKLRQGGYRLSKDPRSEESYGHQGGYRIVDVERDLLILAGNDFALTLEEVEAWAEEQAVLDHDREGES